MLSSSQYDNFRTGTTLHEETLAPPYVNSKQFGKLGACEVEGPEFRRL